MERDPGKPWLQEECEASDARSMEPRHISKKLLSHRRVVFLQFVFKYEVQMRAVWRRVIVYIFMAQQRSASVFHLQLENETVCQVPV